MINSWIDKTKNRCISAKLLYFYKQTNTNDRNKRTKETANNQIYAVSNHDSVK